MRYADDFVIVMRGGMKATEKKVKQVLARMELKLNEEKSRVVDARAGSFDFLGFTFLRKSEERFRDEVRDMTSRKSHCVPQREVLERVNRYVRGWVNYFHLHNSTRVFVRQSFFLEQRMRKYLRGRRQIKGFGLSSWPASRFYKEFGLVAIRQHAPYRRTRIPLR